MRLLQISADGTLTLTGDLAQPPGPYAILSHTWGADEDEVTFGDLKNGQEQSKAGYAKLRFCARQAKNDGLQYFWVDTCCIDKANLTELDEAIRSMFRWYQEAFSCYVYLTDVSSCVKPERMNHTFISGLHESRWFTRGWTLQELLAPKSVQFFSREERLLGTKSSLEQRIHEITRIPLGALQGVPLSQFPPEERLRWTEHRETKKVEDKAYCLLGIFGVSMSLRYGEGDEALKRLKEKISKANNTSPEHVQLQRPKHTHWVVSRAANPWFTGREDVVQELGTVIDSALTAGPPEKQCQIVVSGIGGQGKSELCLQLAHRFRQRFWGVFWVDVSTISTAEASFLQLARTLSLPAHTLEDARMQISNLQHRWLLVLDNADDPDTDYQPYFPQSSYGVVMMTSRNEENHQYATAKATVLDGLSVDAAQDLLMKAARVPADQYSVLLEDATRVASLLQSHPLALIQAGAYVARGGCQLSQYPVVYSQQRRRLLEFRPSQAQSRYRDVYATFEASADALKQSPAASARDALDLLPLLAVGATTNLPLVVFKAAWQCAQTISPEIPYDPGDENLYGLTGWHLAHLPSFLDVNVTAWDAFRLAEAVQQLKSFALVTTNVSGTSMTVSMHPLVHAWARDRQNADEQHKNWLSMTCVMVMARDYGAMDHVLHRQTKVHFESIIEWDMEVIFLDAPHRSIVQVLLQCGWALYQVRGDAKVRLLINKLMARLGFDEMIVERAWLGLYDLAARNLRDCGMLMKSIAILERVIEIEMQSLGTKNLALSSIRHSLAKAYEDAGRTKEAIALLEDLVSIDAKNLAVDNSDRLKRQRELARSYEIGGQIEKALPLLQEVVRIRNQLLPPDHPSRLASQHKLAKMYNSNGQYGEAVTLMEEVVRIDAQTLEANEPMRLTSQSILARMYDDNGQTREAVSMMEEVVRMYAQTLQEDDTRRLDSQFYLSRYLWKLGERKRACQLMSYVVEREALVLPEDDPGRPLSLEWLGYYLDEMEPSDDDENGEEILNCLSEDETYSLL